MAITSGPLMTSTLKTANLIFDAANPKCYPGTGTTVIDYKAKITYIPSGTTTPVYNSAYKGIFRLDGSGYFASSSNVIGTTSVFAMSCWFRVNNTSSPSGYIFNKDAGYGFLINPTGRSDGVLHIARSATTFINTNYTIQSGVWYNGVMMLAGANAYLYINTSLIGIFPGTFAQGGVSVLGKNLVGDISNYYQYRSKNFSQSEIKALYLADRGRFGLI